MEGGTLDIYVKFQFFHIRKILEKLYIRKFRNGGTAEPRPSGTFFHSPPHRLHFLMQRSRPRFSPGGTVQIVALQHHRPLSGKSPLPQITPAPTEHLYNKCMKNINLNDLSALFLNTIATLNNSDKARVSRAFVRDIMEGKAVIKKHVEKLLIKCKLQHEKSIFICPVNANVCHSFSSVNFRAQQKFGSHIQFRPDIKLI